MPGGEDQSKVDLTDLDMWARAVPYEEFGLLRREAPVARSPDEGSGFWSVSRYADIVAAAVIPVDGAAAAMDVGTCRSTPGWTRGPQEGA
jgi:hypothetical protein